MTPAGDELLAAVMRVRGAVMLAADLFAHLGAGEELSLASCEFLACIFVDLSGDLKDAIAQAEGGA